jgi:serpin B
VTPQATGKASQTPRPSLQQATPSQPATPVVTGSVVKPPKPQQPAASDPPSEAGSDQEPLVQGANAFAFELYQELCGGQGNLFYSPYSISLAATMAYAGARAETEAQMASTLHFALPQEQFHPAFGALNRDLIAHGEETGRFGDSFRLSTANALWGQQGYPFLPEFLDTLNQHYGSAPGRLDFSNAPEESRHTINDWMANHTEGRIRDLLPPGAIHSATRLVLANAIYFDASWLYPFDPDATAGRTFHLLDGTTVTVPMMRQTEGHAYVFGQGYQAVKLPYYGGGASMVFLVPDRGWFEAFEGSLDVESLAAILQEMNHGHVKLTVPKFEFGSTLALRPALSSMGMPLAFCMPGADFSGMTGGRDFFIEDVLHQAFVSVDETGTEAAAASVILVVPGMPAATPEPVEITIDRPFVFLIRDDTTGLILFLGRVQDPSA